MKTQKRKSAVFCILTEVQELCKELNIDKNRYGPRNVDCPDSYIISLLVIKNLLGINSETALLRHLESNYGNVFMKLPERSWFNRKAKRLNNKCDEIMKRLSNSLNLSSIQIPDSTPIPVVKLYRSNKSLIFSKGENFNTNCS